MKMFRLGFLFSACCASQLLLAPGAAAHPSAPEAPPPLERWYDAFEFGAFADAYASVNYNFPKPHTGTNGRTRTSDTSNGLALRWLGLDIHYPAQPVGGTINLRFGPAVVAYGGTDTAHNLEYVREAFATWKPGGQDGFLTLDFGKFQTIYGWESTDSQPNMNYTVGYIPAIQPFFHTGLRAGLKLSDHFALTALIVNGWDNSVDNNVGKSFGLQLGWRPSDKFNATLGYLGGPEQSDSVTVNCAAGTAYDPAQAGCAASPGVDASEYEVDRGGANEFEAWRHLVDFVATWQATDRFNMVLNGDFIAEGVRDGTVVTDVKNQTVMTASLGARYQLTEVWALAARGEYAAHSGDEIKTSGSYPLGTRGLSVATGTFTIEAMPTENLILRLDTRGDFALAADNDDEKEIFQKDLRDTSSTLFTSTLGVIVTTN